MLSTEVENADVVEDKPAEKKVDRHAEDIRAAAVKAAKKAALAEKERGDLLFKARIRAYFRPNMNNFLSNEIPSRTKLRPLIKPFLDKCKEALSPGQKAVILSGDEMSREAVQLLMSTWMNWLREGARGGTGSETKFNVTHDPDLDDHADMTQPHDWYHEARDMKRKIILHVGPTNSGKTYHALERLKKAESGVYCGPLRLLAWEVHEKLLGAGVPCNLRTGQEKIEYEGCEHVACTIEMASTSKYVEVAVIDENQLITDRDRGSSWTRALLGIPAEELHVCGSDNMVDLVKEICSITGDDCEINRYQRLTTLEVTPALPSWAELRNGDALIAFSKMQLYTLKYHIESQTDKKCCIIYGALPPEIRREQAKLFNDPDSGYNVLLASDAIGMGLNLNIGRVIFTAVQKFDGTETRNLTVSETLQIAGRAGRKGTQHEGGEATALMAKDVKFLQETLPKPAEPVTRAGMAPTLDQMEALNSIRPDMTFSSMLEYFHKFAAVDDMYFMCDISSMEMIAKPLEEIPLTLKDRYLFCSAPCGKQEGLNALVGYAKQFSEEGVVMVQPPEKVPMAKIQVAKQMTIHEGNYMACDVYIWLAQNFGHDMFPDITVAETYRDRVLQSIIGQLQLSASQGKANFARKKSDVQSTPRNWNAKSGRSRRGPGGGPGAKKTSAKGR